MAERSPEKTVRRWTGLRPMRPRYAAKNIVAAGLAKKCEIQLSYAIGVAQPTSVMVNTFGTGAVPDERAGKDCEGEF